MSADPVLNKLRWRCRRGMQELDTLLNHWLDALPAEQIPLENFQRLLDCEDDLLWQWLSGQSSCPDPELQELVDDIRQTA